MAALSEDIDKERPRGRLKRAMARLAPGLAHALGGPLAGAAVGQLSRAIFGRDGADEDSLADALAQATPETLIALKQAEHEFQLALRQAIFIFDLKNYIL